MRHLQRQQPRHTLINKPKSLLSSFVPFNESLAFVYEGGAKPQLSSCYLGLPPSNDDDTLIAEVFKDQNKEINQFS